MTLNHHLNNNLQFLLQIKIKKPQSLSNYDSTLLAWNTLKKMVPNLHSREKSIIQSDLKWLKF